jgi:outer membrane scaffolding protein for murein synthesis (MipA/OmpV family)
MRYLVLTFSVLASLYTSLVLAETSIDTPIISAASGVDVPLVRVESRIEILSPAEGAKLSLNPFITMKYNAELKGDDSKIYIFLDDKKIQKMRKSSTEYTFERLTLGTHEFCIKVSYKDNTFTGQQRCIRVKVIAPPLVNYGTPLP